MIGGKLLAVLTALLLGQFAAPLHAQLRLIEPGVVNRVQIDGQSLTTQLAIDIPANARHLRLEAVSGNGADIDLLLRYGEPFQYASFAGVNVFGGTAWMYEQAHYFSRSHGPSEQLVVTPYQKQPLRAGRWYLSVFNYHAQSTEIDITATIRDTDPEPAAITVDFNDAAGCAAQVEEDLNGSIAPWFDNQPASPVGGNPGTTLGAQRRHAFEHAMERMRQQLRPIAPIHIRACWADLGGDSERATLASAAPWIVTRNDNLFRSDRFGYLPGVEKPYTWHASAAVSQAMGTDSCRTLGASCTFPQVDVFIQFNRDIGSDDVIGGRDFHYGYQSPPAGQMDFVATAMHEIAHGLGFLSLINTDPDNDEPLGAKFRARVSSDPPVYEALGHNDAYTDAVVVVGTDGQPREINRLGESERGASLTAGDALRWADPAAVASPVNPWRSGTFPQNLPRLYAPDPIEPGSTLSHVFRSGQMMAPFITNGVRDLGVAAPMLSAVGWNTEAVPMPVPEPVFPYGGQWFDPARNGHGIDLQRVVGSTDTYFLILYTFDADGRPEWYTATGRIIDGVFRPGDNDAQNSLWRWRRPGMLDPDIGGQVRIDFANAALAPECNDGGARSGQLGLMDFSITGPTGQESHRWCLTQLLPSEVRPAFDTTGTWYAGEDDSGWGISTLALPGPDGVGLNTIVYLFDEDDQPRWILGETGHFQPGEAFDLNLYSGYCRSCPVPDGGPQRGRIGTIEIDLRPPHGSPGTVSIELLALGSPRPPPGARIVFGRDNSPLILLGESPPAGD